MHLKFIICDWKNLLINFYIEDNLTWEVEQKIYQYNEDISLFCQVENCCPEWAGWWKRISKTEITTIFIDVRNQSVDESSKYDGGTKKGGFFLVIRNVTRHDLNMAYVCTYGFQVSKEKMLMETNAFFDEHGEYVNVLTPFYNAK